MSPEILTLYYNHSVTDIAITIIIFFLSILTTIYTRNILQLNKVSTLLIFSAHNIIFPIYMLYLFKFGSDSLTYFIYFHEYDFVKVETGHIFMNKIINFFDFLKLNFYNINYLVSVLSLFSFYLYLKIIENLKIRDKVDYYILVSFICLPSLHFWNIGFSKDTLTFFSISLIIYQMVKSKPNILIVVIVLLLLYYVRPHISLIVFVSVIFYYLINIKSNLSKFIIIILSLSLSPLYLKSIFNFTDLGSIFTFLNIFQDLYVEKEKTALYSDTNFLLKMFYYMFMPNLFSLKDTSTIYLLASLENTILIFFFIKIFTLKTFSYKNFKMYSFLIVFSFISLPLLAYVTSNIGVAMRQKWIFLPALFILLSSIKYKKFKNNF